MSKRETIELICSLIFKKGFDLVNNTHESDVEIDVKEIIKKEVDAIMSKSLGSEVEQILVYVSNGDTARLKQEEWQKAANKALNKEISQEQESK